MKSSTYHLKLSVRDLTPSEIGLQFCRDSNRGVWLLKILNQRREQSRQRQPRTVECMTEFVFTIRAFVAKIHPARLKIFEIRAARNFEIRVLPWGPTSRSYVFAEPKPRS